MLRLSRASGAIVWDGYRVEATAGWACRQPAVRDCLAALAAVFERTELGRTDELVAPLVADGPESWRRFVFVPAVAGGAAMLLAYEDGPPEADLDAIARLSAEALRPTFDDASLLETARLATTGRLAFSIAHDIGTPLNVISGYAEYLLMSVPPEDPSRAGISTMLEQTRRIAQMIRQMLDLSRPSANQARQRQALDHFLRETIQASSYMLRKMAVKANVDRESATDVQVVGDLPRLQQAFSNVLLNAARLAEPGGLLALRAVSGDGLMPGVEIAASDASGTAIDLGPLAQRSGGENAQTFLEMLLAADVLEANGGAIDAGSDEVRLLVRFGSQD